MSEYVLDIQTCSQDYEVHFGSGADRPCTKYFFTIDINGNVNIAIQIIPPSYCNNPHVEQYQKRNIVSINDNIPIPKYFIDIIKGLLQQTTGICSESFSTDILTIKPWYFIKAYNPPSYQNYWAIVINTIIKIKQEIKELIENPQDNLDIKTQLDSYISNTKQQQENIYQLDKKIENIQTAYFDILNDNNKLKEIIKAKNNKQSELERENNRLLSEINHRKHLDEYNKKEQQKMEELEKERVWREYKLQKQNYHPL